MSSSVFALRAELISLSVDLIHSFDTIRLGKGENTFSFFKISGECEMRGEKTKRTPRRLVVHPLQDVSLVIEAYESLR